MDSREFVDQLMTVLKDDKLFKEAKERIASVVKMLDEGAKDVVNTFGEATKIADEALNDGAKIIEARWRELSALFEERKISAPFTYRECIEYLAFHKKDDAAIARGAITRSKKLSSNGKECWEFTVCFLGRDDKPVCAADGAPLGFKTTRLKPDDELAAAFKNNDLIFVE